MRVALVAECRHGVGLMNEVTSLCQILGDNGVTSEIKGEESNTSECSLPALPSLQPKLTGLGAALYRASNTAIMPSYVVVGASRGIGVSPHHTI